MNCPNCGEEIIDNQKFCTNCGTKVNINKETNNLNLLNLSNPTIIFVVVLVSLIFIALAIGIFHKKFYTDISIENNNEKIEQQEKPISNENLTNSEILNVINDYQDKYFKIIKRHDVLLQLDQDDDCERDMEELKALFEEVKSKINNNEFLTKYNTIEEKFKECDGETTDEMNDFAKQEYDAVDKLLNDVYKVVKAKLNADDFEQLKLSEIKWLKEVEAYYSVFEEQGFGTIRTIVYFDYEVNMRKFRTLLLMLYL